MRAQLSIALIALNIAVGVLAAPQNKAAVEENQESSVSVAGSKKGDYSTLESYQNDQMIRMCTPASCRLMSAGDAKAYAPSDVMAIFGAKADEQMTKALAPTLATVSDSMKGLDAQKAMLENLQKEMAALNSAFSKGQEAADNAQAQYASMTKGISFAPQPPSKGPVFAAAPGKGNSMSLEAAMCPMTMYELGKCQKSGAEMRGQLQNSNTMNSMLMAQKKVMEDENAVLKVQKEQAEAQASYNAKYAAEQKSRADMLELALNQANAEKAALKMQKAQLESTLGATQQALSAEKANSDALKQALQECNEDKAQLEARNSALASALESTQEALTTTRDQLAREQVAHAKTQRDLDSTKIELAATEAARQALEEAKQQLEDELAETKTQLAVMTAERDQLQANLDATSAALATCQEAKMQCDANLAAEKVTTASLTEQLNNALTMLAAEKAAREELLTTVMQVKAAADKMQEDLKLLQIENVQLRQQVMKLKGEQEAALAMASGCPPTYEKFGLSCYKYVREKTQWKMAQEQCMKDGGNLVAVESSNEQAFLIDYLKRHEARFDDKYLHLGGFDYNANGVFMWVTSRNPVDYGSTFWLSNNPRGKGRRCLAFQTWEMEAFGEWADQYCWVSLPFVCEINTVPGLL